MFYLCGHVVSNVTLCRIDDRKRHGADYKYTPAMREHMVVKTMSSQLPYLVRMSSGHEQWAEDRYVRLN